jgi:hypothetical protein
MRLASLPRGVSRGCNIGAHGAESRAEVGLLLETLAQRELLTHCCRHRQRYVTQLAKSRRHLERASRATFNYRIASMMPRALNGSSD